MWQWAHLLGFNLYWVLAVKWQQPGPLLALLLLHFLFSPRRRQDWRLIPVALAGCLLDLLLWWLGLFHFSSGFPLWLVLLWCGFALTLSHGLRWLRRWGADDALVNTQEGNERSLRLYQRVGFVLQPEGLTVLRLDLSDIP